MVLPPIQKDMQFFCRRVVRLCGREYLPGQVFPHLVLMRRSAITWRKICQLYQQRRIVTEADPYFDELMEFEGLSSNPDFARKWLAGAKLEPESEPESESELENLDFDFAEPEIEIVDCGRGWFEVYTDGKCVTPKRVRKHEADMIADKERML